MKNTNVIYKLDIIQDRLVKLEDLEESRIYCRHNLDHFLATARIAYILNLENDLGISKDLIYTTALLHDLGRIEEVEQNLDHHIGSAQLAEKVLAYTDYTKEEKDLIIEAILGHRGWEKDGPEESFRQIFKKADSLSRDCFNCKVSGSCKWSEERKNMVISY